MKTTLKIFGGIPLKLGLSSDPGGRLLALALLALSAEVSAEDYTYATNNGTLAITGYTGPGGAVTIPATVYGMPVRSIGNYAFANGPSPTSVTIPNGITSIGDFAFCYCSSLGSVSIPSSVVSIGTYAFGYGYSLASVTIPDGVASIGDFAFCYCYKLGSVSIPRSMTNIGYFAFGSCTSLGAITVEGLNSSYASVDGVLCNKSVSTLIQCPGGKTGTYAVPNTVANIGDSAFSYCLNLTSALIPSSVTNIGNWAFYSCTKLDAITVAVQNPSYSSVDGVLFNKNQRTLIQCPGGKTGSYAVPNGVNVIRDLAFTYCTNLTGVTLPSSVTSLGSYVFQFCSGLATLTIPDSVTSLGNAAFEACSGLTSVTIGNGITRISDYSFMNCSGLTSLTFPGNLVEIGREAFGFCMGLGSVTIPNGVKDIGREAFIRCDSLTNITLPTSLLSIGDRAFWGCAKLPSITLPQNLTSIGNGSFDYCTSLTAFTVDALNPAYSGLGGVLFNKNRSTLVRYPPAKAGNYAVPSTVTRIGDGAFYHCGDLTDVTIPNGVSQIGVEAFNTCIGLTRITIPSSVIEIGSSAFISCVGLTNATIPASALDIGNYAFAYCAALTGVYFAGNRPFDAGNALEGASAIAYYLPGTSGWGATFGGRPTALWALAKPLILTTQPGFGVGTNGFGFIISWATNAPVVVEATTSLAGSSWLPLKTNTLSGGSLYFSDPQWMNNPKRFYRVRSP